MRYTLGIKALCGGMVQTVTEELIMVWGKDTTEDLAATGPLKGEPKMAESSPEVISEADLL